MDLHLTKKSSTFFILAIALVCLAYLGFELFYTNYAILSVDEFWFAHQTYEYASGLPYRDFPPYKTVLGYYLLLIPMTLTQGLLKPLLLTKNAIALLNASLFFCAALWLKRFFPARAIVTILILLTASEIFLVYSTNIRVDLFAYWFCLFGFLFLLENKYISAGVLIGLGFLASQKALWYITATDVALAINWLLFARNWKTVKQIMLFNVSVALIIIGYIIFWSNISSLHTVLHNLFYEAAVMYQLDWYNTARKLFWMYILSYNPLLFMLWPVTLISLMVTYPEDTQYQQRAFIIIWASVILLCLIPYKQVFPYYMVVLMPAFLVLYSAFFSWFYGLMGQQNIIKLVGNPGLWIACVLCIDSIIAITILLQLSFLNYLIFIIPLLLVAYVTQFGNRLHIHLIAKPLILIAMFFSGIFFPLNMLFARMPVMNGAYQKSMLQLMNALLQDGSNYVAGTEFIYNKTQPVPGMRHLMRPAIDYLITPTAKLRKVMLASLYESPDATTTTVIQTIENKDIKFYVNNYRMAALPPVIKDYLASRYTHYWGSIYLYAPYITAGKQQFNIKFTGKYKIETVSNSAAIKIDNVPVAANTLLSLSKGRHIIDASAALRLQLVPENMGDYLDARFAKDQSKKMVP